jgi:hypothetical protein
MFFIFLLTSKYSTWWPNIDLWPTISKIQCKYNVSQFFGKRWLYLYSACTFIFKSPFLLYSVTWYCMDEWGTTRTVDTSARGQLGPYTARTVDYSAPGLLGPWTTRTVDSLDRGLLGPWTTRTVDSSDRGLLGPWTTRTVDTSSRGLLGPWNTRPVHTSARGQLGP